MYQRTSPPTKEQVRAWLKKQIEAKQPPPSAEEIRRQLGTELIQKSTECAR